MGIISETLYYKALDVEILEYSSILDVLISPIARLTNGNGFFFLLFLLLIVIFLPSYLSKFKDKAWLRKSIKLKSYEDKNQVINELFKSIVFFASIMVFGFFVGTGLGRGKDMSAKIENKEIVYDDQITMMTGESFDAEIVGKNSSYIFYLTAGSNKVKVSPMNGTVKSIMEVKED